MISDDDVFNEKQLYTGDVCGEDDDAPLSLPSAFSGAVGSFSAASDASAGGHSVDRSVSVPATKGAAAKERRRKRAAERATKIVYWLESKYDIMPEVCNSFENWKEAPCATYDFDLLWCDTAIPADRFMKLRQYQKMNHFVGMSAITRKNNLGRNLLRMRKQFPKEYKFFPDTWILPTDLSDFKQQFTSAKNRTFIVKPDNGCQGKGIFLIRDVEKVPVDFSTTYVAQRYIHRPFLLDGYKFDLRLYVLVVGCDPLRIFLHRRGLVRLASEAYVEPSGKNLSQTMVHLTNYAINKMNPNFEENTDPEDGQDGHKRSWEAVYDVLKQQGHDVETLMGEIEDLIVKTLIAVQPSLSHFYHSCQPDDTENAMCFEVLGFDVMLDQRLQPWLLEVNHAPSFATESELDKVVKTEVLKDTFALLNLCPDVRRQKKREAREKMEQRAMGVAKKQSLEERIAQEKKIAKERTAWEDQHLNGYKRLYPSSSKECEYEQIHDAAINIWEMLMGGNSRRSVRVTSAQEEEGIAASPSGVSAKPRKDGEQAPGKEKRTPSELREVVERLMAGCSARPRKNGEGRRRGQDGAVATVPEEEESGTAGGADEEDGQSSQAALPQAQMLPSQPARHCLPRPEVQVGDIIRVQTNLGWESVTVRAKRTNGKIDIQFKDGEYMRSVLPRILREQSGEAKEGDSETSGGASPATGGALVPATGSGASMGAGGAGTHAHSRGSQGGPLPGGDDGGVATAYPGGSATTVEEALATLDAQLSAQIRARRGRAAQSMPREADNSVLGIVPLQGSPNGGGGGARSSNTVVRNGAMNISVQPAPGGVPVSMMPASSINQGARLRHQLQQLVSVRPLLSRRVTGDGAPGLAVTAAAECGPATQRQRSPRADKVDSRLDSKHMSRRNSLPPSR
mmetsp:Transcript_92094/g.204438  ORF Transcript_92094/g.204438 Transcript_92094/m.204438 type:complete len:907 (-) Transcript_92094:236-2956(-)